MFSGQSVVNYYGYDTVYNASTSDLGLQESETSLLFLHEDAAGLSLVIVHDRAEQQLGGPGPLTGGDVQMTISGLPTGATWVVQDDPPTGQDSYTSGDGGASGDWLWSPCCTDGGALSLGAELPLNQCVQVSATFADGINAWRFRSGAGSFALTIGTPVQICHEHASV